MKLLSTGCDRSDRSATWNAVASKVAFNAQFIRALFCIFLEPIWFDLLGPSVRALFLFPWCFAVGCCLVSAVADSEEQLDLALPVVTADRILVFGRDGYAINLMDQVLHLWVVGHRLLVLGQVIWVVLLFLFLGVLPFFPGRGRLSTLGFLYRAREGSMLIEHIRNDGITDYSLCIHVLDFTFSCSGGGTGSLLFLLDIFLNIDILIVVNLWKVVVDYCDLWSISISCLCIRGLGVILLRVIFILSARCWPSVKVAWILFCHRELAWLPGRASCLGIWRHLVLWAWHSFCWSRVWVSELHWHLNFSAAFILESQLVFIKELSIEIFQFSPRHYYFINFLLNLFLLIQICSPSIWNLVLCLSKSEISFCVNLSILISRIFLICSAIASLIITLCLLLWHLWSKFILNLDFWSRLLVYFCDLFIKLIFKIRKQIFVFFLNLQM